MMPGMMKTSGPSEDIMRSKFQRIRSATKLKESAEIVGAISLVHRLKFWGRR